MNKKESTRIRQTKAEINNKLRKIGHLERKGHVVPVVLFERVRELERRLTL